MIKLDWRHWNELETSVNNILSFFATVKKDVHDLKVIPTKRTSLWINLQIYDFYLVQRELDVTCYVDLYGKLIKSGGGLIIIFFTKVIED